MKPDKTLKTLIAGLFTCWAVLSCSPNVKEQETTKPETSCVLQYQENKKIEEQKAWGLFNKIGVEDIKDYKERHDKSIDQTGVGIFYGSSSYYSQGIHIYSLNPRQALAFQKLMSNEESIKKFDTFEAKLENALKEVITLESNQPKFKTPVKTDCLEWCILNLKGAYKKSSMGEDWSRIEKKALERSKNSPIVKFFKNTAFENTGMTGVELAKVLAEEGWVGIYYNPDTKMPSDKPAYIPAAPEDKESDDYKVWKRRHMMWTEHTESYNLAKNKNSYYGIPVTDMVVDYRPTTELTDCYNLCKVPVNPPTVKQPDKTGLLKKVPFGLALLRGGDHTAILSYGNVYETHHSNGPTDKNHIEIKDFETEWDWLSGIIMVPPGSWHNTYEK